MLPKRKGRKTLEGYTPTLMLSFAGYPAPSARELVQLVGSFGWHGLIVQLAGLSAIMTNGGGDGNAVREQTIDVLMRVNPALLMLPYARDFQPYLQKLHSIPPLASDVVILFLQALAVLHGQDDGPTPNPPALAELLLYGNEYAFSWRDDAKIPLTERGRHVADFARARSFQRRTDLPQSIVRASDMFTGRPARCGLWKTQEDWAALQMRAFGMTLSEYIEDHALSLVLLSRSWGLRKGVDTYEGPIVDPAVWYSEAHVEPETGKRFLSGLAITRDAARSKLLVQARDGIVPGPTIFYRKPGMWLPDGKIVMLSPSLLREHLRGGLWGKHREVMTKQEGALWPSAFGELFERSCQRAATIARDSSVDEIIVPLAPGTDDELEDILVRKKDKLLIVSVKASSIPELTLRGASSRLDVLTWFESFLFADKGSTSDGKPHRGGALRLLDRKVSELRAGKWEGRGFPRNLKVYPMVVAYETCLDTPALYRWSEERCRELKLFQQGRVEPPVFSTVEDFEALLALGTHGQSAADILRQKAGYEWRHGMLATLLRARRRSALDLRLPQVTAAFDDAVTRCTERLFGPTQKS